MSRILKLDSEGNDITPMCEIADGLVLDDGCRECSLKNDCPGYYDGCFEAVNRSDREDRPTALAKAGKPTAARRRISNKIYILQISRG